MSYFTAKMHQIRFRLGVRPRPCWGVYSAPHPLAGFKGAYFLGKGLRKDGSEGKGMGGDGRGISSLSLRQVVNSQKAEEARIRCKC